MALSRFFVLQVLHDGPAHGYDIGRAVERTTNGCCSPSEGALYPTLREFEQGAGGVHPGLQADAEGLPALVGQGVDPALAAGDHLRLGGHVAALLETGRAAKARKGRRRACRC